MLKQFTFDSDDTLEQVLEEFEEFLLDSGFSFEGNLYVVDTSEFIFEEDDRELA